MECSCDIDVDHDGGPVCHKEKIRKAKKPHLCCECGLPIKSGDHYLYESGIWDGTPQEYKTCLDCKSIRDVFFRSWVYTQIWDYFCEEFKGLVVPESCISELTPKARSRVCHWIENQWRDEEE